MTPARLARFASFVAASLLTTGASTYRPFMFPALIMVRAPGHEQPIIVTHAGMRLNDVRDETLVLLYATLAPHPVASPATVRRRPHVDLPEFFGPEANVYVNAAGPLARTPRFEDASHHSRIYLARDGDPPLWDGPVIAPGGARDIFYALGEQAQRMLEARGVTLR